MKNYGQNSPTGAEGKEKSDIQALDAWAITKGSHKVKVAIVDTGIDYNHPDLKANVWTNQAELNGVAGVDDDGNGYADDVHGWNFVSANRSEPYHGQLGFPDPMDDNEHSTHLAKSF
jgi:subtilisin family serine protease